MIPFNKCYQSPEVIQLLSEVVKEGHFSGDGNFTKQIHQWFEDRLGCQKALLTPSCTAALEMAAILINVKPGDEIIMPSYTFVSTANAFVLRGAKIVFVDVNPDTMNIDETLIEQAITEKTIAIVPVHYAGVACEMDTIMRLACKYDLFVIEDAAQGVMSTYKGKPLGSIGHLGTFSFHATKNYTSGGEGGLLIVNKESFAERAEIIREKGTNRTQFINGKIDKYTWVSIGGSHLASELQAAFLLSQLREASKVNNRRLAIWNYYQQCFAKYTMSLVDTQSLPNINCVHNGHMFYIKLPDKVYRASLMKYLDEHGISSAPHYIPLHISECGIQHSVFIGDDKYTTSESDKLLRLPMFYQLDEMEVEYIVSKVSEWDSLEKHKGA
ncbi:dTDP-4-amino-4,6-dideoxygalactose transaminase [Vibrio amylolyticus]|uniref:dTDP-4-amino-4,6-dideoxygalactose transaminase n=1 Tax=Vibrio amylolyticus TaxID=2847292 RepID=UPI00354E4043